MSTTGVVNLLVESLSARDIRRFLAIAEVVDLELDAVVCEPDMPQRFVYFPCNGFISLVVGVTGHPPLEIALIGNEGMLGVSLPGVAESPLRGVVQGGGDALRMDIAAFRQLSLSSTALTRMHNRYLLVLLAQFAHGTACTHFHEVEPRLAKWLLMTHDRAHTNHFRLTHQFLAYMLGVQRSAVTIAAGSLQQRGLISYSRGEIIVIDRQGLESAACECYNIALADYSRYFGIAR